jgi:hypothetical protein
MPEGSVLNPAPGTQISSIDRSTYVAAQSSTTVERSEAMLGEDEGKLRSRNRILNARLEGRRLRLDDTERHCFAELGHRLGGRVFGQIATIVTPDTILRWHRELVAASGRIRGSVPGVPDCRLTSAH